MEETATHDSVASCWRTGQPANAATTDAEKTTSLLQQQGRVRAMVAALYTPHRASASSISPAEANVFLADFQQQPAAWTVCVSLLNQISQQQQQLQPQQEGEEEEALIYFAAQTLAAQGRAGFPQQLQLLLNERFRNNTEAAAAASEQQMWCPGTNATKAAAVSAAFDELRCGLVQLFFGCRSAARAVVRQLATTVADALAFEAASCCSSNSPTALSAGRDAEEPEQLRRMSTKLDEVLVTLGQNAGAAGAGCLLELLIAFPEELCSKRLSLPEASRLQILTATLQRHSADVFVYAASLHQFAALSLKEETQHGQTMLAASQKKSAEAIYTKKSAVQAIRAWISAHSHLLSSLPALAACTPPLHNAAIACCKSVFLNLQQKKLTSQNSTAATGLHQTATTTACASTAADSTASVKDSGGFSALDVLLQTLQQGFFSVDQQSTQQSTQQLLPDGIREGEVEALHEASEAAAALVALAAGVSSLQQQAEQERLQETDESQCLQHPQQQLYLSSMQQVISELVFLGYASACAAKESQLLQSKSTVLDAESLQGFSVGLLECAKEVLPAYLHHEDWPVFSLQQSCPQSFAAAAATASSSDSIGKTARAAAARQICSFVLNVLLRHGSSLDVKEAGLDFHYNLLFHFMTLATQQQQLLQHLQQLQQQLKQLEELQQSEGVASAEEGGTHNCSIDGGSVVDAAQLFGPKTGGGDFEADSAGSLGMTAGAAAGGGSAEEDYYNSSNSRSREVAAAVAAAAAAFAQLTRVLETKRQHLLPIMSEFLEVLLQKAVPPSIAAVLQDDDATDCSTFRHQKKQKQLYCEPLDLERWGKLRDEFAVNIAEATTLVTGRTQIIQQTLTHLNNAMRRVEAAGAAVNTNAAEANSANTATAAADGVEPWQDIETCLFMLTTLAPRCRDEECNFIPLTLELLPRLLLPFDSPNAPAAEPAVAAKKWEFFGERKKQLTKAEKEDRKKEVAALFLYTAAGRFLLWTAGYAAQQKLLFAALFDLLTNKALAFIRRIARRQSEEGLDEEKPEFTLRQLAEEILTAAVKALVAAAAHFLVDEAAANDVNLILNSLLSLVLQEGLSIDSRASLIFAAGAMLAPMKPDRMRTLHSQLLNSLGVNLREAMSAGASGNRAASASFKNACKLFFSAIQCLRPAAAVLKPPTAGPADLCESLPPDSIYRHPVLDVVEEHWSTIDAVMKSPLKHELLYEQSCYSLLAVVSTCRSHISHYTILFRFLENLAATFAVYPTAYQLGALRSLEGLFGNAAEEPILFAVQVCIEKCAVYTLERLKEEGEQYVYRQPDLVGMTVDCVNIALLHPRLAVLCLLGREAATAPATAIASSSRWFETLALAVLQLAPTCHHPKVLHTFMVFFSRVAGWTSPPARLHSFDEGSSIPWLLEASEACKNAVLALLLHPVFTASNSDNSSSSRSSRTYLSATIHAIVQALTSVHVAVQSWIGNAAQALQLLLHHPTLAQAGRAALEAAVMELHPHVLSPEQRSVFLNHCLSETNIRHLCITLQQAADDAKSQFQRSKFAAAAAGALPVQLSQQQGPDLPVVGGAGTACEEQMS